MSYPLVPSISSCSIRASILLILLFLLSPESFDIYTSLKPVALPFYAFQWGYPLHILVIQVRCWLCEKMAFVLLIGKKFFKFVLFDSETQFDIRFILLFI